MGYNCSGIWLEQLQTRCRVSEDGQILGQEKSWSLSPGERGGKRGGREGVLLPCLLGMGEVRLGLTFLYLVALYLVREESAQAGDSHSQRWAKEEIRWLELS